MVGPSWYKDTQYTGTTVDSSSSTQSIRYFVVSRYPVHSSPKPETKLERYNRISKMLARESWAIYNQKTVKIPELIHVNKQYLSYRKKIIN